MNRAERKRQRALAKLLNRLNNERGQLDTPDDEAEIDRYVRMLGGSSRTNAKGPGSPGHRECGARS